MSNGIAAITDLAETRLEAAEIQGQTESKTVGSENRSGAYLRYVSTGSAGNRHLQAGLT